MIKKRHTPKHVTCVSCNLSKIKCFIWYLMKVPAYCHYEYGVTLINEPQTGMTLNYYYDLLIIPESVHRKMSMMRIITLPAL